MVRLALLLAALAVSGCASEPPDRPVPIPDWRDSSDPAVTREGPVNWTDGLSLPELLRAVERHGRSRAALEEWEAARARRRTAGIYPMNPELMGGGAQSVDGEETMLEIGVSQTFELGGRVSKREAVADAGVARAGAEARDVARELRSRARKAYWAAVIAARRLEVAQQGAELAGKDVEVALARYEARQASAIDMNMARVSAGRARAEVRKAEGGVLATRAELEALVWEPAPPGWTLAEAFPRERPEPDLAKALASARRDRPDLAVLDATADEAGAREKLASAEAAPDLGLRIGYEFGRERIEGDGVDFRMTSHSVTFGASISLPLWNRRQGEVLEAQADRRRAIALREALDSEVGREVVASAALLKSASATLGLYETEVLPAASKNLEDVRAAYATGGLGITEFLKAQQDYVDVLGAVVEAEAAYLEAKVELEGAVDGPLEEMAR